MSMKINRLEIENVKRIKAVKLEPAQNGLPIIKHSLLRWMIKGKRGKPRAVSV